MQRMSAEFANELKVMSEYSTYKKYAFISIDEIQKLMLNHHPVKTNNLDMKNSERYRNQTETKDENCVKLDDIDILNLQELSSLESNDQSLTKNEHHDV